MTKILLALTLFSLLIGCSEDRKNPFRITSVLPSANQKLVSPESSVIANFTLDVDQDSFVNRSADVGSIIDSLPDFDKYALFLKNAKGQTLFAQGKQPMAGLTIADLQENKYALTLDTNSQAADATRYQELKNYLLFRETRNGQEVFVLETVNSVTSDVVTVFSKRVAELEGLFLGQDTFVVKESTSAGLMPITGKLTVSGKKVTFKPDVVLKWDTDYQVSINKNVLSADGAYSLSADFGWSFKTEPLPEPNLTSYSPTSSTSSPVKPVSLAFNFDLNPSTNWSSFVRVENIQSFPNELVDGQFKYDTATRILTFTPTGGYFEYSHAYRVTVLSGLSGTNGQASINLGFTGGQFSWTFSTPTPAVVDYSPIGIDVHPDVDSSEVRLEFNFLVDQSSINASTVQLLDRNGALVPHRIISFDDLIFITPVSRLNYGESYKVVVTTGLRALVSAEAQAIVGDVNLANNFQYTFYTQDMKLISQYPNNGFQSFIPGEKVVLEFNFDVATASTDDVYLISGRGKDIRGEDFIEDYSSTRTGLRTIEISTPGMNFYPNLSTLYIGEIESTDGQVLNVAKEVSFNTVIGELSVTSRSPLPNSSSVDLDEVVSIRYDKALDVEPEDLDSSNFISIYEGAGQDRIFGLHYLTFDDRTVEFDADFFFLSHTEYFVDVENVTLTDRNERSPFRTWSFVTDGLEIEEIEVDKPSIFADEIYVDSDFAIIYDRSVKAYRDDFDTLSEEGKVRLLENGVSEVPIIVTSFGSEVTVDPIGDLRPDTSYELVIDYDAYVDLYADLSDGRYVGLTLDPYYNDYSYTFRTEGATLSVLDYSPVDTDVDVDEFYNDIYVELDTAVSVDDFVVKVFRNGSELFFTDYDLIYDSGTNAYYLEILPDDGTYEYNTLYSVEVYSDYNQIDLSWSFFTGDEFLASAEAKLRQAKSVGQTLPTHKRLTKSFTSRSTRGLLAGCKINVVCARDLGRRARGSRRYNTEAGRASIEGSLVKPKSK